MLTRTPQAPNPSNVLGVFGLSIRTVERQLEEEFSRYGHVDKVTIVYDARVSGLSFGIDGNRNPSLSCPFRLDVPVGLASSRWQQSKRLLPASKS